jgi:hypothetical protein
MGSRLRVRVEDRAVDQNEELLIRELSAFLGARDYFVTRVRGALEVVPYNPVSERGDRERLERALVRWRRNHPSAEFEILT